MDAADSFKVFFLGHKVKGIVLCQGVEKISDKKGMVKCCRRAFSIERRLL